MAASASKQRRAARRRASTGGVNLGWRRAVRIAAVAAVGVAACIASPSVLPVPAGVVVPALAQALPTDTTFPIETDTATPVATMTPTPTVQATSAVPSATDIPAVPTVTAAATPPATPAASATGTDTPTATPTAVALPPVSPQPDAPGTVVVQTIDDNGGIVITNDGRAALVFPSGALSGPATVSIRDLSPADNPPAVPGHRLVNAWQFSAADPSGQAITSFTQPVTVVLRLNAGDAFRDNASTLQLWTLDPIANAWLPVAADVSAPTNTLTAGLSHFSVYGLSADSNFNQSTFSDSASVDLHGGGATLSIPIEVPAGPGGLTPDLSLTYDSGRVNAMRSAISVGSWVGIGWQLGTGSISGNLTMNGLIDPAGYNLSLQLAGTGGRVETQRADGLWYMSDHTFERIELFDHTGARVTPANNVSLCAAYSSTPCYWRVTDKKGTQYFFGDLPNLTTHATRYNNNASGIYQWDLSRIIDVNGNQITFTYTQIASAYVVQDAYPSLITWDGGLYSVAFDVDPQTRQDVPPSGCAPPVEETQRLLDLRVLVNGQQLKKYAFAYVTTAASCSGSPHSGNMTLQTMTEYGASSTALRTMTFSYDQTATVTNNVSGLGVGPVWPLLTGWNNGLGGNVAFSYASIGPASGIPPQQTGSTASDSCWTQTVVASKSENGGAGQPPVVNTYAYAQGPDAEWASLAQTPPVASCSAWFYQDQRYLGFGDVTVTDGAGDVSEHCFNTSRTTNPNGVGNDALMTGRERETWVWAPATYPGAATSYCAEATGSGTGFVKHVTNTWQSAFIDPCTSTTCQDLPFLFPHFVSLFRAATIAQGSVGQALQTYVQNIYDVTSTSPPPANWYGDLLQTDSFVGLPPINPPTCSAATSCVLSTFTPMIQDTADWIFVPQSEAKTDPLNGFNPNQLLSCTRFYYDGQTAAGVLPQTGAHGLVTAKSTAVTVSPSTATACTASTPFFSTSTNTYTAYDPYGNTVGSSVATGTKPESSVEVIPFGASVGWVINDAPYALTEYSAADNDHVTPSLESNPVIATAPSDPITETTTHAHNDLVSFLAGTPAQVNAPNGRVTNTLYDVFGRAAATWDNLDSQSSPTRSFQYRWGGAGSNQTTVLEKTGVSGGSTTYRTTVTCLDGFGREVEQRQSYLDSAFGPVFNSVRTDYDAAGRKGVVTNAIAGGSRARCSTTAAPTSARDRTVYAYDALGTVTQTTYLAANQLAGPSKQAQTDGTLSINCDERFNTTKKVSAPAQRTLTVYEPKATRTSCDLTADTSSANYTSTSYVDDALGRLTQATDANGNQTTLQYDMAGRKTSMTDPDMGHWSYGYYPTGKLQTQTDARGVVTHLNYDALNRLIAKTYVDITPPVGAMPVTFAYDQQATDGPCATAQYSIGHLAKMTDASGSQWSCYDVRGRETWTQRTVGTSTFNIRRAFDPMGNLTSLTYPDSESLTYTYGSQSETLTKVSSSLAPATPLITQAYVTPWGAPGGLAFGNGEITRYAYDYRERIVDMQTGTTLAPANDQHLAFTYDDASNVTAVTDKTSGEVAGYTYDQLNRLTAMTLNGVSAAAYDYNAIGNMTSKQEGLNGANALTNCYPASGSAAPHAVTKVFQGNQVSCSTTNPWLALAYDADGNLASQGSSAYAFDADNRLTSRPDALGGTDSYVYDGSGTLLKRVNANGTWTVYIGGIFEADSDGTTVKYYKAAGRSVAMRDSTGTLYYLIADHLGSTAGVMNSSGVVVSSQKYWPYGAVRTGGVTQTDKLYTGQQQEMGDPLGLYDYKARFYSTVTGRFVSPDTSARDGLNRLSYVDNNPLGRSDPTGRCINGLHCSPTIALNWLSCALEGNCFGRTLEEMRDMRRLAWWAMTQLEFYGYITDYAQDRDYANAVRSIRYTVDGDYTRIGSPILAAGFREIKDGEPGHDGGPPIPVTFDATRIVGKVHWRLNFSYLDYEFSAHLEVIKGDSSQGIFAIHIYPDPGHDPKRVATTGIGGDATAPLTVNVDETIFWSIQEVHVSLSADPGEEPPSALCNIPYACDYHYEEQSWVLNPPAVSPWE